MPYSLKKVGSGYKICSPTRCFSKKPLSRTTALKQLAAIQINSRRGGADDIEGGTNSDDSDSDKEEEKKEKKSSSSENALDKIDKKEVVEIKKKKKSKLRSGLKSVGKLVQGFIHFIDQAVEGTIETVSGIGGESKSKEKKSDVTKLKEAIEERAAKAEIHYAIPLYDVIVKNLYDKLGWMLLAKKLGKYEKVQMYKNEIKDTLESMKNLAPIVSPKEKEALNMHYQRLLVLYEESRVLL